MVLTWKIALDLKMVALISVTVVQNQAAVKLAAYNFFPIILNSFNFVIVLLMRLGFFCIQFKDNSFKFFSGTANVL